MSVHLTAFLYELCGNLILKTPVWIFNNEWFENTTLLFSSVAIGIVTTLTVVESIKRMLTGVKLDKNIKTFQPMDFKLIAKRWAMVSFVTTAVPFMFQKAFLGLNWVSDKLIQMGSGTMQAVTFSSNFGILDVITLVAFDLVLMGTVISALWQNGRRFFDLIVLGVITPVALTAWIFDDYRHLFRQWWDQVKHLSLVQVYYALFLLVLGWFIFGLSTPATFSGLMIKLLVTLGGFNRMISPPRLISKHLDSGGGLDDMTRKGVMSTVSKTRKNLTGLITSPLRWYKVAYKPIAKSTGNTRMSRLHKK